MTEQPAMNESTVVEFDFDAYQYLADKGPTTAIGLVGDTPDKVWFQTLRILALRKGYSCLSGVAGYYLVNNHGVEEEKAALAHTLPALLHPADEGMPAVYGLRWKIGESGQIYAMCLPTDLKQHTDKDGVDTWLTESDVVPRRLNLFKSIQPIENKDGHPLAKKFDVWMKDHSVHFGELKLKSLLATRGWLAHGSFSRNFLVVYRNAEAAIRVEVKKSTGEAATGSKKKTKATKAIDPTTAAEISRRCAVLDLAVKPWQLYVATIAVPLGQRIVELNLGEKEGDVTDEELENLVKLASPLHAAALCELLKASDKAKLLVEGKASISDQCSPFPTPAKPAATPAPADVGDDEDSLEFRIHSNEETELSHRSAVLESKRKRAPPDNLSPEAPKTKKTGATSKKPILVGEVVEGSATEGKPKRQYNKTGIHSRDPMVAAAARLASRSADHVEAAGVLSHPDPIKPLRLTCLPLTSCPLMPRLRN